MTAPTTSPTPSLTPTAAATPAFDPKGKSFLDRLAAFQADALATYAVTVHKDSGRTAAWQQKHHVAHMFAYNKYTSTQPANVDKGERTISWTHLQDASVVWEGGVLWSDFLRTKSNGTPVRDPKGWKAGQEPDKAKTLENVKALLVAAKIGNSGTAMVSSGMSPCGEPCKCGAGRSKHLEEAAADLNSSDLTTLTAKLTAAKAGDIDAYLAKFGLHRPLVNHPESPEEWHVEATD
ncbi:hypothetical protein J421_2034 [Gemmatirosa kalamazoonensis]|jgi:hypothetical protein|uniref:Uncharacterized protein n=1 Tax=Gemmatirosa kalamazoonensis TaxID=861299 RepID=W0RFJ4_9BACT|nr:hypothetical protein [Gemmatirosa kalamazoonensis]AHG89571.1 hypothetical protein J421_2034 [Gemmatirosa kalamazoonensis]